MIEKLLKAVSLNDGEKVELSLKEEIICTIIIFLIIGLLLYFAATSSDSLSANNEKTTEDSIYTESTLPHAWGIIKYGDTGAYLEKDGDRISSYYKVIEEDYDYDTLRVIGMNGLYGFISKYTGTEQIKPCFKEAYPMNYSSACVSADGKNYYFIDENGNKMTGDYEEAYPWECHGQYARVKTMNGWAIINRKGKTLIDKCIMINTLPDVTTTIGTAFRNDKGILFCIDIDKDPTEISVIAEIPNILDISELHYDNFAVIQGEKGYGVISAAGNIIFDPIYKKVDWEALPFEDDSYGHKMIFKCQADDGHYETINWDPRNR
jgi:hypothetical protein